MQNVKKRVSILLKKYSKSIQNDADNMLKSLQMAAGVRGGHPSEPLGRKFVPRVAREDETRRSQARLGLKMVHTWGPRGGHFQMKSGSGWPRIYPKIRL